MPLVKCPRCELNYMQDSEKVCTVCKRELRGEELKEEAVDLCTECSENSVAPGEELCVACLREMTRQEGIAATDDTPPSDPSDLVDVTAASSMDEIETEDDAPEGDYKEISRDAAENDDDTEEEEEEVYSGLVVVSDEDDDDDEEEDE